MKTRLTKKLALSVAILLVSLVFVEAAYRVSIYGWGGISPTSMESVLTLSRSGILQANDDPQIRFELKPDHKRLYKMVTHETNSVGLRDREYDPVKPEGTRRVAVLGDSWTMGLGVERAEIYHEVVERRLNEASASTTYEWLNFGVAAYGLPEYAGVLRAKALAYDPDLIVVGLTATDTARTPRGVFKSRPPDDPFWELHALNAAWAALVEATGGEAQRDRFPPLPNTVSPGAPHDPDAPTAAPAVFDPPPEAWPDSLSADTMAFIREGLVELAAISDESGVPMMLVFLTQNRTRNPRGNVKSQAFRKVAAELGLPYLDTADRFGGRALHDSIIFTNDTHPNAEAHALLADAIFDELERRGWVER